VRFFIVLLFALIADFGQGQNVASKTLHGRVIISGVEKEAINISNRTKETSTIADENGNFSLLISIGDLLFFSAVNLKSVHYTVQKDDVENPLFTIKMFSQTEQLKEVLIEKSKLDAVSLGILAKPAKVFTPAERKYNEATTGGGFVPLNPILNYFSGRTAMLKKEIEVEKKEKSLLKTEYMFDDDYYIEVLKIPVNYIKGFQFYCVEDVAFAAALQAKNKVLAKFLLVDLSKKYVALINQK
jgi:hypothetical protein